MDTFQVLAEPTRRTIVELLANHGQMSAGEICRQFSSTPPAISQHLKVLREAQIIQVEKVAQRRMYYLNMQSVRELDMWTKQISQLWKQRFEDLDALLQKQKRTR